MSAEQLSEKISSSEQIYSIAEAEIAEIAKFIPPKGIPVQERAKLNAVVRQKLPVASDLAIVQLMLAGHDLSRREFLARLKEQRITQPEASFELMAEISYKDFTRGELFMLAWKNAVRCTSPISVKRMVDIFDKYGSTPMERDDREVFADILNAHSEKDEVIRQFLERKAGIRHYIGWIADIQKLTERRKNPVIKVQRGAEQDAFQLRVANIRGDMGQTVISFLIEQDGDVILSFTDPEKGTVDIEFCTKAGGGKNPFLTVAFRNFVRGLAGEIERQQRH